MTQLTDKDIKQLKTKGINPVDIEQQLENFKSGFPPVNLARPATVNDGIHKFENDELEEMLQVYSKKTTDLNMLKFIPASGAASRMFKFLYEYIANPDSEDRDIKHFINGIKKFAFYEDLDNLMKQQGLDLSAAIESKNYTAIIETLVSPKGLCYGSLPKALLKFHRYKDHARTALEEHLVEGVQYIMNSQGRVDLHFTISPEHEKVFLDLLGRIIPQYEKQYNTTFNVDYSFQKESTDMVAVDLNNQFIRKDDGSLLFRPGGHGALLENLNKLESDIIFIKNIDNVVPDRLKKTTVQYKKALAGLLLKIQERIFKYLEMLEDSASLEESKLKEILEFTENKLSVTSFEYWGKSSKSDIISYLKKILNRPIRVCGMVKNEGEPGGGPFWVKEADGGLSLQIVEKAQIDTTDKTQKEILENSTHFNPVDLVCGVKNYKGEKFDLLKYRDLNTGIISKKSKDGQELKAQELPGLWNGGMAFWNTIFVEVPLVTFNPVKTVNDLLREEHQ